MSSQQSTPQTEASPAPDLDAVIVGAGFAGLYMLYRMRDVLGLKARVYCYSFSEELEQEWEWTSKYPEQPEILRYLDHVADRFDLRRDIQLGTRIAKASFDEATDSWVVHTEAGER